MYTLEHTDRQAVGKFHAVISCEAPHSPHDVNEFYDLTGILLNSQSVYPGVYPVDCPGVDLFIILTSIPLSQIHTGNTCFCASELALLPCSVACASSPVCFSANVANVSEGNKC